MSGHQWCNEEALDFNTIDLLVCKIESMMYRRESGANATSSTTAVTGQSHFPVTLSESCHYIMVQNSCSNASTQLTRPASRTVDELCLITVGQAHIRPGQGCLHSDLHTQDNDYILTPCAIAANRSYRTWECSRYRSTVSS